jgi:hypothetical protein
VDKVTGTIKLSVFNLAFLSGYEPILLCNVPKWLNAAAVFSLFIRRWTLVYRGGCAFFCDVSRDAAS